MDPMDLIFSQLPEQTKMRLLSELARRGDGQNPAASFETAEQFNAWEEPPLTFLVEGLLARGQLAVLGGRAKSGKSWLVAQLAQALDTGAPFLGRPTTPARVLYLPLEDKRSRLKRRSRLLGWLPQTTLFHYNIGRFNGTNSDVGPGLTTVERVAYDFDVILIDTLIATLDGHVSENDNTAMGAIVNALADIAHASDCAIVLVHHTNKGGMSDDVFNQLRGASAIRGAYDVGLLMDRRQGEQEAVLHVEARDFEATGLTIRQRENGSGWDAVGEAKAIVQIRAGRNVIFAIEELGESVTNDDIAEFLGLSRQAVSQQLILAERDGRVIRKAGVFAGKGRPKDLWSLTGSESANNTNPANHNESVQADQSIQNKLHLL